MTIACEGIGFFKETETEPFKAPMRSFSKLRPQTRQSDYQLPFSLIPR